MYTVLKRLETNGMLKTYRREYNGRSRKYYKITRAGRAKLAGFKEEHDKMQLMLKYIMGEDQ
jgi:PadR family transcriptional regulator PadR